MLAARFGYFCPFDPRSIPNLGLWLDASDSSTLYNATTGGSLVAADGTVARWEDKSGNARHATQGTSTLRPTRKASVLNGKDTLRVTGTQYFTASYSGEVASIFVVGKQTGTSHRAWAGAKSNAAVQVDAWYFKPNDPTSQMAFCRSTSISSSGGNANQLDFVSYGSADTSNFYIQSGVLTSTSIICYKNGTAFPTGTTTNSLQAIAGPTAIFASYFNDGIVDTMIGDIAELLVFSATLSAGNRQRIERWLGAKWGITVA